jgi:hypothetical protein
MFLCVKNVQRNEEFADAPMRRGDFTGVSLGGLAPWPRMCLCQTNSDFRIRLYLNDVRQTERENGRMKAVQSRTDDAPEAAGILSLNDKDEYLDWLKAEIQHAYNCPAYFLRTEMVHERIEGNTVWLGDVEIFCLVGHSQAKRCFAWGHDFDRSDLKGKPVAILEMLPVLFAQNAVRTQLAKDLETERGAQ